MTVVRIALDAMGGDHAPQEIVKGALLAAAEYPIEVLLVGQEEVVRKELAAAGARPNHLREFAVMGHFYAQMVFGLESPRVGLLSIGEEEGKGNELTKEVFRVLKETGLNFIGNAEGRDVYNGNADVVVCDGFIGNVVLKASEALGEMVSRTIREELMRNWRRKIGGLLARSAFDELKRRIDYSEY